VVSFDATFNELLAGCERSAVHLEMRDSYTPSDPALLDWLAGRRFDPADRWSGWLEKIRSTVARGVVVRRARIVSEPVSDYIRFEHDVTDGLNIAAGELVRWLPRREASDLALPGNDFWVFDGRVLVWNHFAGNGDWVGEESSDDPAAVKLCVSAFEAVWERGVDHAEYRLA
jgi:hypothetical protein